MEFLTLHQLSRELNKPEKVLRYKFKNLLKKNTLVEGEDFIREGYIDDQHFVFKINPVRFARLTELSPAPPPDTNGYQGGTQGSDVGTNVGNHGYQTGTESVTNIGTKTPEVGTQHENMSTADTPTSPQSAMVDKLIGLLEEQLREKDKQLKEKDEQLKSKDEILKRAQDQAKESQQTQYLALSEIVRLNKHILPPRADTSVINVAPNGYQTGNRMDTHVGTQGSGVGTNVGNHGYQSDPVNRQQNNFESDPSSDRGVGSEEIHQ
jgi:hypothetical protein